MIDETALASGQGESQGNPTAAIGKRRNWTLIMASQLVLSGGGIKSAVAAACCAKADRPPVFLHVDYGQPSAVSEHRALVALIPFFSQASLLKLPMAGLETLDRMSVQHARAGVVHSPAGAAPKPSNPLQPNPGLVPLLMSAALYTAFRVGADSIVTGFSHVAPTDHLGLPATDGRDTLREALYAFRVAAESLAPEARPLTIETPLLNIAYPQIVKLADRLQVPLEHTWSCSAPGPAPCSRCRRCQLRETAFAEAVQLDPLLAATSS
jgi:7-cyano-7-deazaguanine synthase in queuosine biosynthesis